MSMIRMMSVTGKVVRYPRDEVDALCVKFLKAQRTSDERNLVTWAQWSLNLGVAQQWRFLERTPENFLSNQGDLSPIVADALFHAVVDVTVTLPAGVHPDMRWVRLMEAFVQRPFHGDTLRTLHFAVHHGFLDDAIRESHGAFENWGLLTNGFIALEHQELLRRCDVRYHVVLPYHED